MQLEKACETGYDILMEARTGAHKTKGKQR